MAMIRRFLDRASSYRVGCLVVAMALVGVASPASALPQLFTFAGSITFSQDCGLGEFGTCEEGSTGDVSYTFLVDGMRLGERIVRSGAGETVTTFPGTFFAEFTGTPAFSDDFLPPLPEFRTATAEHVGSGVSLHDLKRVEVDPPELSHFEVLSTHDVVGLAFSSLSIGSQFEGHQFEFFRHPGTAVLSRAISIDSSLTLTEIHGVPEPGVGSLAAAGVVALVVIAWWCRRATSAGLRGGSEAGD